MQQNILNIIYKTNRTRLKEKNGSTTRELGDGEFPVFAFCSIDFRLGTEQVGNPEMPIGTDKEKPQPKPALSSPRTRKRAV